MTAIKIYNNLPFCITNSINNTKKVLKRKYKIIVYEMTESAKTRNGKNNNQSNKQRNSNK
jgi:hypothetical protein